MYNWDNDLYINVLWTIIEEELIMSMVLGYISVAIVLTLIIYVMGRARIHRCKDDKKSSMVGVVMILALVLALIISIVGLILKGMGL